MKSITDTSSSFPPAAEDRNVISTNFLGLFFDVDGLVALQFQEVDDGVDERECKLPIKCFN